MLLKCHTRRRTQMVKDKITLCRQMLPESAGVEHDDALSEVVGFLEACRPRMVDLVEAGMGGALGEDIFANCLQVCKTKAPKRAPSYDTVYRTFTINARACLASVPWKACRVSVFFTSNRSSAHPVSVRFFHLGDRWFGFIHGTKWAWESKGSNQSAHFVSGMRRAERPTCKPLCMIPMIPWYRVRLRVVYQARYLVHRTHTAYRKRCMVEGRCPRPDAANV